MDIFPDCFYGLEFPASKEFLELKCSLLTAIEDLESRLDFRRFFLPALFFWEFLFL